MEYVICNVYLFFFLYFYLTLNENKNRKLAGEKKEGNYVKKLGG